MSGSARLQVPQLPSACPGSSRGAEGCSRVAAAFLRDERLEQFVVIWLLSDLEHEHSLLPLSAPPTRGRRLSQAAPLSAFANSSGGDI